MIYKEFNKDYIYLDDFQIFKTIKDNGMLRLYDFETVGFIYSIKDDYQFLMTLTVDTYAKRISIFVRYINNTIFAGEFDNVFEIRKDVKVNTNRGNFWFINFSQKLYPQLIK